MMNNSLFKQVSAKGEIPFSAKFNQEFEEYFNVIDREQILDQNLWELLERQFDLKNDQIDNGWRGEFWGKLMRGACLVYAHNKNENLYSILQNSVLNMLEKVDEFGRISTYSIENEYNGWDVWSRKYVMLGMEYFYDICSKVSLKERICKCLEGQADYIVKTVGEGKGQIPISKTSKAWGAINSVSILQPFVMLNKICPKTSYQNFMDMLLNTYSFEDFNIFEIIKNDNLYPYQYRITKAYEMISCVEGLLNFAQERGDCNAISLCQKFADKILETDFTVVGGIGCKDEYFDNSTKKQVVKTEIHKQETCVTVTLMRFLYSLYLSTGKKEYIDAIERSFFNAYLGALNDKPYYGYYARPLFYSYSPIFDEPRWTLMGGGKNLSGYARFGCCVAIGACGIGVLPKLCVLGNKDQLTVNLFISGEYSLEKTKITIESDYPQNGNIKILIKEHFGQKLKASIRYPAWAKGVNVYVNQKPIEFELVDGYIVLNELNEKDVIDVRFLAPITITKSVNVSSEVDGLYSVSKGAIVYAAHSDKTDLSVAYDLVDSQGKLQQDKLILDTKNGMLELQEYRNCGKDYNEQKEITVWIKSSKYKINKEN